MKPPIVIIGGMGPQASLRFHNLLVEQSRRFHQGNGDEFPYIVHYSVPVTDFISDSAYEAAAIANLDSLTPHMAALKPKALTLACNTAHRLIPRSRLLQQPAFISMITVVVNRLRRDGVQRVGLLASPTTIRTRLYEDALLDAGIQTIVPSLLQQQALEGVIRRVINGTARASEPSLQAVGESLRTQGAQAILLGCTELPLVFDHTHSTIPTYDCLELYANAVIEHYYLYNGDTI